MKGLQILKQNDLDFIGQIWLIDEDECKCLVQKESKYDEHLTDIDSLNNKIIEKRDINIQIKPQIEGGQHLNANCMNREMLLDAQKNPDKYPQLVLRVSGYAIRFNSLTAEQQNDIITRTFTEQM